MTDLAGNHLDGDANGTGGDDYRFDFFRYYGDLDADRDFDFLDLYFFNKTYGKPSTSPDFIAALDHNSDATVDATDLAAYREHYLTVLAPADLAGALGQPGDHARGASVLTHKKVAARTKLKMKQPQSAAPLALPKLNTLAISPSGGSHAPGAWETIDSIFASRQLDCAHVILPAWTGSRPPAAPL